MPAVATGSRIDINAAPEAQLDSLPGIGPVRAKAIVAGRPYEDVQDLTKKKVLTAGVLAGIKDRIALANINTSSAAELQRTLPGVGDVRSKAIVAGRPYATPADLVAKKVLTQGVYDGIKDLVAY
jgi:DNA uptake protein ComE-like DNA-binding protein